MDDGRSVRRLPGKLVSRLKRGGESARRPEESAPEAATASPLPEEPLVSVVVPVYAVEDYVDACLSSVLGQSYRHLEVVVVDDGSPDGSMDIVARHAAADDRVRIVRQENAGLGAARNRGISEARGDLVTFVDSDDTLPESALRHHVRALVRSGSDFSVGALERQAHDQAYVQKPWSRRLHEVLRRHVTIDEVPEAMANVFACTKVFRREFLEAIDFRFPVGVRYEDQVPVTRAYLRANAFDILPDIVYSWRARRDGSSITQQKARADDLHDRLQAVDEVARMVRAHGSRRVLQGWYGKVFEFDLFAYIRASLDADDAYYAQLAETVGHVLDGAPPEAWAHVDLRHRISAWALVHTDRATLTALLESPLLTGNIPVRDGSGGLVADAEALGLPPGIPPELLFVTDRDLLVEARLEDLGWTDDALRVRGVAFTRYVDSTRPHEVALTLSRPLGDETVVVPATRERRDDANVFADRHYEDHRDDGFVVDVPVRDLVAPVEGPRGVWHTRVTHTSVGESRSAVLGSRVEHGTAVAPHRLLVDGVLLDAQWSSRLGLVVQVRRDWVVVTGIRHDGASVHLDLLAAVGVKPRRVRLQHQPCGDVVPHPDGGADRWVAVLDTAALDKLDGWAARRLVVETEDDKQPLLLLAEAEPVPVPSSELVLLTADGFVRVARRRAVLLVDAADLAGGEAVLRGRWFGDPPAELTLAGPRSRTRAPLRLEGPGWRATLRLTEVPWVGDGRLPLPRDQYAVDAGEGTAVLGAVGYRPDPVPVEAGWQPLLLEGGRLVLDRGRGEEAETHSRHGQQQLQAGVYAASLAGPLRPTVLIESFVGRGGWHGPAAVARSLAGARPDLRLVWAVRDESLPVPAGTTPVVRQSAEWFEHAATAQHIVTNQTLPRFFEKAPGQRVVQLWTGTPVLRFGHALEDDEEGGGAAEVRTLDRNVALWDVLYTGGPAGTAWMREATRFPGDVREVGHPALDPYRAADRDTRAALVRERLGLGPGPVLLYAPTTRQFVRAHTRRSKVRHFDVEELRAAFPDLTVLHRGHPTTANRQVIAGRPGLLDVTGYPELADLVLAADAVVTDYSTLLVDVLATDVPVALLVPDLDDFEERGFFPDLFGTPPGPVAQSTEELLPWLRDGLHQPFPGRDLLREQLLPLDDGAAADRIVAAEFGGE